MGPGSIDPPEKQSDSQLFRDWSIVAAEALKHDAELEYLGLGAFQTLSDRLRIFNGRWPFLLARVGFGFRLGSGRSRPFNRPAS